LRSPKNSFGPPRQCRGRAGSSDPRETRVIRDARAHGDDLIFEEYKGQPATWRNPSRPLHSAELRVFPPHSNHEIRPRARKSSAPTPEGVSRTALVTLASTRRDSRRRGAMEVLLDESPAHEAGTPTSCRGGLRGNLAHADRLSVSARSSAFRALLPPPPHPPKPHPHFVGFQLALQSSALPARGASPSPACSLSA